MKTQYTFWSGEICRVTRRFTLNGKRLVSLRGVNGKNTYSGVDATWPRFYSDNPLSPTPANPKRTPKKAISYL